MIKAAIIGSTGYVGEELTRILLQHPDVELSYSTSQSYIGKKYNEVYENFNKIFEQECVEENIEEIADKSDLIYFALPHGLVSNKLTSEILSKTKVIDIGADFRLKDKKTYEEWYETEHHGESLLKESVYGLCEWEKHKIKDASLVANPGCYATCSILSLAPLLKENVIDKDSIIIDAKSGVSGAGRTLNLSLHFTECNETIKAYKIASHRHTPEIEQELCAVSGKEINLTFTPHLVPMNRGILATIYAKISSDLNYEDIKNVYHKYYADKPFIRLMREEIYPETKWVKGSNYCDIGFKLDKRTNNLIIVGAIDNMIKGAAGQAVQNMNIMFGLDEKTGLNAIPVFPI